MRELDDGVVRVFVGNLYERQYYLEDCPARLAAALSDHTAWVQRLETRLVG